MIDNFPKFGKLTNKAFQEIAGREQVFMMDIDPDALYAAYLSAFPEGTDPKYKERTEHDCSCCKQFIRHVGAVISVGPTGKITTVWEDSAEAAVYPYNEVAKVLDSLVRHSKIKDIFCVSTKENSFGSEFTRSQGKDLKAVTWNHFHSGPIPKSLQNALPDKKKGDYRTTVEVFERGLQELKPSAVEQVLELIEENAIYRGDEHKKAVKEFKKAQTQYLQKEGKDREVFVWANAVGPASRLRNTVIGSLLQDISKGDDITEAVKSFEKKVAPDNYKRTKALITPAMIKNAMETIKSLDLESALERRFAKISDISVNDVLWVDNAAKSLMKGGLEDMLLKHVVTTASELESLDKKAEAIDISEFMKTILPTAVGMEVLFAGNHVGNLMSLTAPKHPEPKQLFKWDNDFAWSYNGNVADSFLRQQVQKLGGRVDGVLRFSHMWNHVGRNASLMDLHVFMAGSGPHKDGCYEGYPYGQRVGWNHRTDKESGGNQDVDYTAAAPEGYVPVENITFPSMERLKDGEYTFKIHNWSLRQPTTSGFKAEIEFGGKVFQYDHPAPLKSKEWITLAIATLKKGVFTIEHKHPVGQSSQEVWGLTTEKFVKVNAVTLSPNYWGKNASGNKHTFFVLDGAKNDEAARGIYNEFLHPRLEAHRKVFEVIGDKTKCQPTEGQLSGLGFSSTKKDSVIIRVNQGKKQRLFNVQIGN